MCHTNVCAMCNAVFYLGQNLELNNYHLHTKLVYLY